MIRDSVWSGADAVSLQRARRAMGHTWRQCIGALVELGGPEITQGTLSKWENGKSNPRTPESIAAVRQYCELAADETGAPNELLEEETSFADAVGSLLGERPLGARQAQLFDAVTKRLEHGPPLSEADASVVTLMLDRLNRGS